MTRRLAARMAVVGVLLGLLVEPVLAGGVLRESMGARSAGRGGTNLGFADNGEILHDNPAGMVRLPQQQLVSAGVDLLITDLSYADADNPKTGAADNPFPSGEVTYIRRSDDGLWAYGLGVYAVAGFSSKYELNGPAILGGQQTYKSLGMVAKVLPGISCQLTERLSVGATLGVAASHMELEGPYFLQGPNMLQSTPLMLDLQATGAAPTWSVGMQYQLSEATTLGVAYQSEMQFDLDGNAAVTLANGATTRYQTDVEAAWPQSVGLGLTHHWCPHHTSAADVYWYGWSQAFDSFRLRFADATTPGFPDLNEHLPLNWRDTVTVRVGHEYRPNPYHVFRVGYIHSPNPVPDNTLTPYLQATIEHTFSIGYGWRSVYDLEIDLAYQFGFGADREVGTSSLLGGDFSNSRQEAQIHWISASLMRRF